MSWRGRGRRLVRVARFTPTAPAPAQAGPHGRHDWHGPHGGNDRHAGNAPHGPLVERAHELKTLTAAVARLTEQGRGGVVTLTAAAGLGKSALVTHAAALAGAAGCRLRRATASPLERQFPFGVVRELLETPLRAADVDARRELLDGAAAPAGRLLLEGAAPEDDATTAVAHSVARLCAAFAEHAPLVLLVDDAHWADRRSLEVLCHLARRGADMPLLVIVAARGDDPEAPADLLGLLAHEAGPAALRPRPLTVRASVRLLRGRLAPAASLEQCRRCHAAAAGNPWLLTELGHRLAEHGAAALDVADAGGSAAAGDAGAASADDAAPVREQALAAVRRRLAGLSPAARRLASVLAVAGDGLPLTLAGRVAGLHGADLGPARDALQSAGLLAPSGDRLAHALIAAATCDELSRSERERLHRAAAEALLSDGAPAARVAGHLLRSRPAGDAVVSTLLRAAAEHAWRQGAPRTAVAYLRRALEERAPGDERARLLALLATCSFDAGLPDARARLHEALHASGDRAEREDVLRRLAALSLVDAGDRELEPLLAREQASARDDGERLRLELIALDALVNRPDRQPERARRLHALAPAAAPAIAPAASPPTSRALAPATPAAAAPSPAIADPLARSVLLAHRAWLAVERGSERADVCAALARAALAGGELRERARRDGAFHLCVRTLLLCDRLAEAELAIGALAADSAALGSTRLHAAAAWFSAELALRAGRLEAAERHARQVLTLLGMRADAFTRGAVELLLHVHAERGEIDAGRALLAERGLDAALGSGIGEAGILHARARLALAAGEVERCRVDALAAGRLRVAHGRDNPAWSSWRATAALALAQLGRRDEAAALAEAERLRAERFGAPSALLIAAHAAAVAEPDDARRIARCEAALAIRSRDPAGALARTRLQLELGAALRVAGRRTAARDSLRAALAGADAAGAVPLAERARRELVASGLRPRRAQTEGAAALTPRQRQVCELAAAGVANRAIGQRLFLSVKTVETHLASSYRKLGVETRTQLAAALAAD